jgi:Rho GDP-dissociation inhibitor
LVNHFTDAGDESLQRYKESLGLGSGRDMSDPKDPRVCIIESLTMEAEGRGPVTIDLSTPGSESTLKDKPFKIKEGAKFTMSATFRVQHEILSGLHYVQVVKRKGIRVSKDSEMIVSRGVTPYPGSCTNMNAG